MHNTMKEPEAEPQARSELVKGKIGTLIHNQGVGEWIRHCASNDRIWNLALNRTKYLQFAGMLPNQLTRSPIRLRHPHCSVEDFKTTSEKPFTRTNRWKLYVLASSISSAGGVTPAGNGTSENNVAESENRVDVYDTRRATQGYFSCSLTFFISFYK